MTTGPTHHTRIGAGGLLVDLHAGLVRELPDGQWEPIDTGPASPTEHRYLSTACLHGLHDRCRRTCKFCNAPCQCTCHALGTESQS
jgi:hypothetical protein